MSKAPCKNCVDRQMGCHSTCDKYLAYRKELDELNKVIEKTKQRDRDYMSVRQRHLGR